MIGVAISISTAIIGWQTFNLSNRAEISNEKLKEIEQRLSETRLDFDRIRDVYDRAEKYLSLPRGKQDTARGRIMVLLINNLPDPSSRRELLAAVVAQSKNDAVAASAADIRPPDQNSTQPRSGSSALTSHLNISRSNVTPEISAHVGSPAQRPAGRLALSGELIAQFDADNYRLIIQAPISFTDSQGVVWTVPKGAVVDGSGVPRPAWAIVGSPLSSDYKVAAVFVDYFSQVRSHSLQETRRMFYEILQTTHVDATRARILFLAYATSGPRW